MVVKDIEKTVQHYYEAYGIGPFRVFEAQFSDKTLRGRPAEFRLKIAMHRVGGVQLEFIQVLEGDTVYQDIIDKKGEGLHHLGFFVNDLDKHVARLAEQGISVIQSGRFDGGGFAYLDTEAIGGVVLELIQWPARPSA